MTYIQLSLISGMMVGIEFVWGEAVIVDMLIVRLIIGKVDYTDLEE